MPRPVTLFTGQWADVPLGDLAPLAKEGYDGLELARCRAPNGLRALRRRLRRRFRQGEIRCEN